MERPRALLVLIRWAAAAALLVGCGAATAESTKRAVIEIEAQEGTRHETPVSRSTAVGLAHPDNDPEIVAAVRVALACAWDATNQLPPGCPYPMSAMNRIDLEGKSATLARLLDDDQRRVRMVGLQGLQATKGWSADKPLAEKLLTLLASATLSETAHSSFSWDDVSYLETLVETVSYIDLVETGTADRLKALMSASEDARLRLLGHVRLTTNPSLFDMLVSVVQSPDESKDMRSAALRSFRAGVPKGREVEACALLFEATRDPNESIVYLAADLVLDVGVCASRYDALLKVADEQTTDPITLGPWPYVVRKLASNADYAPKRKTLLVTIGKRIADQADKDAFVRIEGLRAVVAADPNGGRAYATKLATDQDPAVREAAARLARD